MKSSMDSEYEEVQYSVVKEQQDAIHVGHCLLYAPCNRKVFETYQMKADILMQMRFDGSLGFWGGFIEKGEAICDGVNRELREELNLDTSLYRITDSHHLVSFSSKETQLFTHLFAIKVKSNDLRNIEKKCIDGVEYGAETMGLVRVPTFTMEDGKGGLAQFLSNKFVGSARLQLVTALVRLELLPLDEVQGAVLAAETLI